MAELKGAGMFATCDSLKRSTTALEPVGKVVYTEDGAYLYVKAAGALTASGDPVSIDGLLSVGVKRGDLDVGSFIGVSEAPFASGEYGYIKAKGLVQAVLASGTTVGGRVQLSATVGQLTNITTSGDAVGIALEAGANDGATKKYVWLY